MGYTTTFEGRFKLDKPLKPEHYDYLVAFHDMGHVNWNVDAIANLPDPVREAVGLPIGENGGFFVGDLPEGDDSAYILDRNHAHRDQPGLYCQWIPTEDRKWIQWDEAEKFYHWEEWLLYLITQFLEPWGYMLNGEMSYQGEDIDDYGKLVVRDNDVDIIPD